MIVKLSRQDNVHINNVLILTNMNKYWLITCFSHEVRIIGVLPHIGIEMMIADSG